MPHPESRGRVTPYTANGQPSLSHERPAQLSAPEEREQPNLDLSPASSKSTISSSISSSLALPERHFLSASNPPSIDHLSDVSPHLGELQKPVLPPETLEYVLFPMTEDSSNFSSPENAGGAKEGTQQELHIQIGEGKGMIISPDRKATGGSEMPAPSNDGKRELQNNGISFVIPIVKTDSEAVLMEDKSREDISSTVVTSYDFFAAYEQQIRDIEPIIQLVSPWGEDELNPGDKIMRNIHWLRPSIGEPKENEIRLNINGENVTLHQRSVETGLVLVEPLLYGGEHAIGHARRSTDGQEVTIRPAFLYEEDAIKELQAIQQLEQAGYPVPAHAQLHQYFYPWLDTITYDWVSGESFRSGVLRALESGDMQKALDISEKFGTHMGRVWEPLLEGNLPSGLFYLFPDNIIENFIYTGNPDPTKAFVRIDVRELSHEGPLGSKRFFEQLEKDLRYMFNNNELEVSLMESVRNGFANAMQ